MNIEKEFPFVVYVNLAQREDRRREMEWQLHNHGICAVRQMGIRASWVRNTWGFMNERRYACSLAKRMAIRRAKIAGEPAVLLFEDDLIFHQQLRQRLNEIELPDDWGLFFLGCRHFARPEIVSPGLVRCFRATDNHAVAVRAEYYDEVIRGLSGHSREAQRTIPWSDMKLADCQDVIPSYAAFPNLVWQAYSHSDTANRSLTTYHADGRQKFEKPVAGLYSEMARVCGSLPPSPRQLMNDQQMTSPAFVAGPRRWRLEDMFPICFYVNLGRRADRRSCAIREFAAQKLSVTRQAAVDARNVKDRRGFWNNRAYACALSHRIVLRKAKMHGASAVLCFEDDVVLHERFRELAEALELPEDWGIFYFGCVHREPPEILRAGIVRPRKVFSAHAYAVREPYLNRVISAFGGGPKGIVGGNGAGCDVALSALSSEIPTYAAFPNLAWQGQGFSDIRGHSRAPFDGWGRQRFKQFLLAKTERDMTGVIEGYNLRSRGSL